MNREDKGKVIESLIEKINQADNFYLTDISDLNAGDTSELRRTCFKQDIELLVVKNSLLEKALEGSDKNVENLGTVLKGHTSIMFSASANEPAKLIKSFRKTHARPLLKGAYVLESVYVGDNQLDALVNVKSKNELIGDIVMLLQSPINRVMSSLQSGSNTITGVLETLSKKEVSVQE